MPVGIVAYINGNTRFAVALTESDKKWGGIKDISCLTNYNSSTAITDMNGKNNTICLVNYSGNIGFPAAEYCNNYKPVTGGTGSNGWYLPAAGEFYAINSKYNAINNSLQKLSKTQISANYYWTSSEINNGTARTVRPSDGNLKFGQKTNSKRVRCILTF